MREAGYVKNDNKIKKNWKPEFKEFPLKGVVGLHLNSTPTLRGTAVRAFIG